MRDFRSCLAIAIVIVTSGCASQSSVKTLEVLDESTGMTVVSLAEPISFTESVIVDPLATDMQPSRIHMGPVEWDRSGDFSYLLWVQVSPGVDGHRLDDLRERGAVTLTLDDGAVALSPLDVEKAPANPYRLTPPVGQTVYFRLDVQLLKRMATTRKIGLKFRGADLTMVDFVSNDETQTVFNQFMAERNIAADSAGSVAGH